ncbi:hypothetical protein [Haemophilus paraphrohaemolyticus]|nr:hypothetical protein [Haemophilus paraphrohaemolyticus]OOR94515.1 hypothetical protein B0184_05755 [Haemophilus paraphrohaemolyticus]STP01859.1 Uncharacterised protein [Haemophilus paraphrohaemolyticus]
MENVNLEMIRGDDDGWTFEVLEESPTLELTQCRFDLHIKPGKGGIIKLSSETGEITTEGNLIHVVITHSKTENETWEQAQWDLQCIDPNQKVTTLVGGDFTLIPDITRNE